MEEWKEYKLEDICTELSDGLQMEFYDSPDEME